MNEPMYVKAHGIKVIKSPIYLWHSSIHNRGDIPEYEYITISADTFTTDDLKKMYLYGWTAQAFHSLGILEYIAKFYNQLTGLKFIDFYAAFIEYCKDHAETLFGKQYRILIDYVETGYSGGGWDHHDPDLAPIFWPIEEATWLRCVRDGQALDREILAFLDYFETKFGFKTDRVMLEDLVHFQVFLLSTMDRKEPVKRYQAKYGWKEFLINGHTSLNELDRTAREYSWNNKVAEANTPEWCYKAIWVGRNQCNYKCHPQALQDSHHAPQSAARGTIREVMAK
jgi:hypothetical protein